MPEKWLIYAIYGNLRENKKRKISSHNPKVVGSNPASATIFTQDRLSCALHMKNSLFFFQIPCCVDSVYEKVNRGFIGSGFDVFQPRLDCPRKNS